jgi:hypothetical protein
VEGLVPAVGTSSNNLFAYSRDGRVLAAYIPARDWLEESTIQDLEQQHIDHIKSGGRLRIYFHRGISNASGIGQGVELRRIPFSLLIAAGAP